MIEFFIPILEHFYPLFIQFASQMGLILPRWVSLCPEYHHQPLFFTQLSQTPFYVLTQNTPNPTPKHPFPWKWAKWTTVLAKWTPTGQNVWKVGKTFLEVGNFFIHFYLICSSHQSSISFLWTLWISETWRLSWNGSQCIIVVQYSSQHIMRMTGSIWCWEHWSAKSNSRFIGTFSCCTVLPHLQLSPRV